jgi:hypothetical protein
VAGVPVEVFFFTFFLENNKHVMVVTLYESVIFFSKMFACEHGAIGARVVARQRRRLVLQRVRAGGGERGTQT